VRHAPLDAILAPEHQRVRLITTTQQILGVVQARVGKPKRTRHTIHAADNPISRFADDIAELPDTTPELVGIRHRPGMQADVIHRR
jgi:hypothetical protein